jgi:hypothetical protein
MAVTRNRTVVPLRPMWPTVIDPAQILLNYDREADRMAVVFDGAERSSVVDPVDGDAGNYLSLRLDAQTEDVLGVELESVTLALHEHPGWRDIVVAAPTEPVMRRAKPVAWPALLTFVDEVRSMTNE